MPNINKVVYGNTTLIDLTDTTAEAADVAQGKYFYGKDGVKTVGTATGGGGSGGIIYQDLDGYLHLSEDAANVISIVDELDTAGGTIRTITGATGGGGSSGYSADDVAEGISGNIALTGTSVRVGAFTNCSGITSISAPNVTVAHTFAFYGCSGVSSASFPSLTTVHYRAFNEFGTDGLSLYLPLVTSFPTGGEIRGVSGSGTCFGDAYFSYLILPIYNSTINTYFMASNPNLLAVDYGQASSIAANCFNNCPKINTVVLRRSSLTSLANISAFTGSPFASDGSGGTLYVPNDLISTYESATNWSTILAYTNNQIKSIESTHTDPTAPIDLTLYYADGTLIPST